MAGHERPRLTQSDAWLALALTAKSRGGHPVSLADLVESADWIERAVPTFDEVSFGIPRLVTAGLLTLDGQRYRPTPRAQDVYEAIKSIPRHSVLRMAEALGVERGAQEDRSLGRLPGLTHDDLDRAVRHHSRTVALWSSPAIAAVRLGTALGSVIAAIRDRMRR